MASNDTDLVLMTRVKEGDRVVVTWVPVFGADGARRRDEVVIVFNVEDAFDPAARARVLDLAVRVNGRAPDAPETRHLWQRKTHTVTS